MRFLRLSRVVGHYKSDKNVGIKPSHVRRLILFFQESRPALGDSLVHLFDRDGRAVPFTRAVEIHNRALFGLEDKFTMFAFNEANAIPRLEAELLAHFDRYGDLALGCESRTSHGAT